MVDKLTINQLLKKGIDVLKEGDFNNPLLDVQLLLSYALNVDRLYLYTHRDDKVDDRHVDKFYKLLNKRKEGYPLQYIIEKQEFMGLDFFVGEGVLVPRPDTEILVESVIEIVKEGYLKQNDKINIVDIGTGSGAISLSLAHYLENVFVYSIDISKKALAIANKNRERFQLENKVKFLEGDLLSPLDKNEFKNKIDIIVSNPPYIPSEEIDRLQIEVAKYEPRTALDGGEDGLDYYKKIISEAPNYLSENGLLAFEIGYNQGNDIKKLMEEREAFDRIEVRKDLAGKDRVVIGYANNN